MVDASGARAPAQTLPGPLAPTETFGFSAERGPELHGELFVASPARGVALVVHGYAEHCGRYREVAAVLVGLGLTTLTFDLRGHGRSGGARGQVRAFTDYLDDVDAALRVLDRRASPTLPLFLVCHSNGALIGLRLLADPFRRPARLVAAALSSPFLKLSVKVPAAKRLTARLLGRALPNLSLPANIDLDHLTHDAGKLAERRVDTLCHDVANARWYVEVLATQDWVTEFAPRIAVPTLWLVAGADQLCVPAVTRAVAARVAGSEYHEYPGLAHEVFNETTRGEVFDELRKFLSARLANSR